MGSQVYALRHTPAGAGSRWGRLAERMKRIGHERTRAVWAVPVNGGVYEVFVGGTRLEAAKLAGLEAIPVLVHYGYAGEDISRLSDVDNENDEYHRPVPVTDVWAEYARLYEEEGWTQDKIGQIKGVSQDMVSLRLKLHRLPRKVKDFTNQGLLSEMHLIKIAGLRIDSCFAPWLTAEQAMLELAEKVVRDKQKNGEKSVRALETDVAAGITLLTFPGAASRMRVDLTLGVGILIPELR